MSEREQYDGPDAAQCRFCGNMFSTVADPCLTSAHDRIAELEAEVGRLNGLLQVKSIQTAIRDGVEAAIAASYERGALEFAEWCDSRKPSWNVQSVNGDVIISFGEALARFLASRGTGIAESKGKMKEGGE